jgi:maltose alpha-D-glucosyltransferase / alpha-amylase
MSDDDSGGVAEPRAALERIDPRALTTWLASRRWFADKGREITGVAIEDALVAPHDSDWIALNILCVTFRDGESARYFVPLALTHGQRPPDAIAQAPLADRVLDVVDAAPLPWFGDWFRHRMTERGDPEADAWQFVADAAGGNILAAAGDETPRMMGGEQSNTSLRYDDALIVKLIRRLQPGPNPDEEVLRALGSGGFSSVPRYVGGASWRAGDGTVFPIALAQGFVANEGDGWSWMLGRLAAVASGAVDPATDPMAPERILGRRTAEMHLALSAVKDAAFAPEPTAEESTRADEERVRVAAEASAALLREREADLPQALRSMLPEIEIGLRAAADRASGFAAEADLLRIRVHGDYHLGQTLRTPDGDWVIVDFEGEPARPVAERRRRQSALKDVAGMLRSFGYARAVAEREAAGIAGAEERIAVWEGRARAAFLDGYREVVAAADAALVPRDQDAFMRALAAWEIDKALYEIAYEARNRPDWIAIPSRVLVEGVEHETL